MSNQTDDKGLPLYNQVRKTINEISDYTIRNVLRIFYLFGVQTEELIGRGSERKTVTGLDFYVDEIDTTEAILLDIKTVKGAKQKRTIAIPLGTQFEPMSEKVLNFVENLGEKPVWEYTYENLNYKLKKDNLLKNTEIPVRPYKKRKSKLETTLINLKHFAEIRELELSLCHRFNEIDLKIFNGDIASVDYNTYYPKLLNKTDYYYARDVYDSMFFKNVVFNPQTKEKYNYREYMEIQKLIKRGEIGFRDVEMVTIDPSVDISDITAGQSGSESHKVLMKNAMLQMGSNIERTVFEKENLDVFDIDRKIVVECAQTFARKLLGCYTNTFEEIRDVREFWILQDYKENYQSKLFKFRFN